MDDDLPGVIEIHPDPDLLELIPWYLDNRQKDLEAIAAALGQSDLAAIARLGHIMKGTGGAYGFDGITQLGAALEQAANQDDVTTVRRLCTKLSLYLSRVVIIRPA